MEKRLKKKFIHKKAINNKTKENCFVSKEMELVSLGELFDIMKKEHTEKKKNMNITLNVQSMDSASIKSHLQNPKNRREIVRAISDATKKQITAI